MIEVLVLIDVKNLADKEKFEKHVKKEGFVVVPEEPYVYTGESTTTTFATKAYILEVFKKGLEKTTFDECQMVFLLNETLYPASFYDNLTNNFELAANE